MFVIKNQKFFSIIYNMNSFFLFNSIRPKFFIIRKNIFKYKNMLFFHCKINLKIYFIFFFRVSFSITAISNI
jgi:hypothetical protein